MLMFQLRVLKRGKMGLRLSLDSLFYVCKIFETLAFGIFELVFYFAHGSKGFHVSDIELRMLGFFE